MALPLLVSGRDDAALRAQADRYADWLSRHAEVDWSGVVRTAALHRTQFAARASVSARDAAEAAEALRALGDGRRMQRCRWERRASVVGSWRFCSRGRALSSWAWARRWLKSCAGFRAAFEEVCSQFDELLDMPLRVVLFAEEGSEAAAKLNETAYTQPALFAVEVALFRQLKSGASAPTCCWGIP